MSTHTPTRGCIETMVGQSSPALRILLASASALTLLAAPISAEAALFTFQSNRGDACLPTINSATPISGAGSCTIGQPSGGLTYAETIGERWRADFTSLGLFHDYSISGDSTVGRWSIGAGSVGTASVLVQDQLTISGGVGNGILRLGLDVHGSEFLGDELSFFVDSAISTGAGAIVSFDGPGAFLLDIPFAYDAPVFLARSLSLTWASNGLHGDGGPWGPYVGTADYLNSADYTFSVLDAALNPVFGSTISSDTGFVYSRGGEPTSVPEPATLVLLGVGLAGLGLSRRKRARSQ